MDGEKQDERGDAGEKGEKRREKKRVCTLLFTLQSDPGSKRILQIWL